MHPILFKPFGFAIYSYSVALIASFLLATALAVYLARKRGPTDSDYLQELAVWGIVWGIIGSRLGYVIQHPEYYLHAPLSILNLREGGMTILGGIITPVFALWYSCYRRKIDVRNVLDTFSAPLLLGMAIGRIGCILHGCCYGDLCKASFPFAMTYPQSSFPPGIALGPRYPTQGIEALADLLLMGFVIWLLPRIKFAGQAFWVTLAGYGLIRFLNEFIRADGREISSGGVTIAQLTALAMTFVGLALAAGLLGKPAIDVRWQVGPDKTTAGPSPSEKTKAKARKGQLAK